MSQKRIVWDSDGLWKRRFGSDASVTRQTLRLGKETHSIVGVMPSSFRHPSSRVEFWVPVADGPGEDASSYQVLARVPRLFQAEVQQ